MTEIKFDPLRQDRRLASVYASGLKNLLRPGAAETLLSEFEAGAAAFAARKRALLVNSGRAALELSMRCLLGRGAGVLIPNITHPSLAYAALKAGCRPVFVDVNGSGLNMDISAASGLCRRAKALIAVHMFSNPCDMERVRALASAENLAVIEDVSQAFGVRLGAKMLGSFGEAAAVSLSFGKPLSAPYAGAGLFLCDDETLYKKASDIVRREPGWRASLLALPFLSAKFAGKKNIFAGLRLANESYSLGLRGLKGAEVLSRGPLSQEVPVLVNNRDSLLRRLEARGIPLETTYPALNGLFGGNLALYPQSRRYLKMALHLPVFPLMSAAECGRICAALRSEINEKA